MPATRTARARGGDGVGGGVDGDEERASDLGSLAAGATGEGGEGDVKFSQVLVI